MAPTAAVAATPTPDRAPSVWRSAVPSVSPSPVRTATPIPTETPTPEPTATDVPTDQAEVDWRDFVPTDTADHLATMARAAKESDCGVPWQLLAAIARVESDFGRNMSTSSAGALGYGQFLPSSWALFGSEGNVYDYRDALPAIALYLCKAGLERDPRTALFAYNHADWYVDLVLNLAVQYDRMAPGAPTPEVLGVGPSAQQPTSMRYAKGRDLREMARTRQVSGSVRWLGVPWQGRTAGEAVAPETLQKVTLGMLRLAVDAGGDMPPIQGLGTSQDLRPLADAAWSAGLLPQPAVEWTLAELRSRLERGQPVVVLVGTGGLPGHPADEPAGEQPLLLTGTTPTGFIYADPSFSSSLGYGLELSDVDFEKLWDAAARPRQALAFSPRPAAFGAHVAEPVAPVPITRIEAPPTPTPMPVVAPTPTLLATLTPESLAPTPTPAVTEEHVSTPGRPLWVVAVSLAMVGALALRRWRAGRWL
jgi:transglycosylase-like protein with SLT domain